MVPPSLPRLRTTLALRFTTLTIRSAPCFHVKGVHTPFPFTCVPSLVSATPVPMHLHVADREHTGKRGGVLRSRPTCHGIRRTVIDIARESLVFFFFRIILRLNPCRTGLLQLLDLVHVTLPYRTHTSNPHHVHSLMDSLIPCYPYPLFPLTSP